METRVCCREEIFSFLGISFFGEESISTPESEAVFFNSQSEIEEVTLLSNPFLWIKKAAVVKNTGGNDGVIPWPEVWAVAEVTEVMCAGHFRGRLLVPFIEMCKMMVQTGLIAVNMHAKKNWVAIATGNDSSGLLLDKPLPAPALLLVHSFITERKKTRFVFNGEIYFENKRAGEITGVRSLIVPSKWLI